MRKVLIAAGTSGIGREIAAAFLAAGDRVYTYDIDEAAFKAERRGLRARHTRQPAPASEVLQRPYANLTRISRKQFSKSTMTIDATEQENRDDPTGQTCRSSAA